MLHCPSCVYTRRTMLLNLLLKSSDGHFSFHYSFAFKFFLNSRLLDPDNLEPVQSKVPLTDSSKKAITCFVSVNCSKGRSMFSQGALTVAVCHCTVYIQPTFLESPDSRKSPDSLERIATFWSVTPVYKR